MQLKKYLVILLFLSGLSSVFAQNSATGNANISIQVKKGLAITSSGDIDFGEHIMTGSDVTLSQDPETGVTFAVSGHPNRDVTVSFSNVTLNNNTWAGGIPGATTGTLDFIPNMEHTGTSSSYAGQSTVSSGDVIELTNDAGIGKLYLWLGGDIDVQTTDVAGDYIGTFGVTVTY